MGVVDVKLLLGLSKPLNTAIKQIGAASAALYEPTAIRRRAKANADAGLVAAESEAAQDAIRQRAQFDL